MMKKIWDFCKDKNLGRESKIRLFLFLNIICWCGIGAVLWLVVSRVALDNMIWLFVFIGYAGVFPGWIGGMLKMMNMGNELLLNK